MQSIDRHTLTLITGVVLFLTTAAPCQSGTLWFQFGTPASWGETDSMLIQTSIEDQVAITTVTDFVIVKNWGSYRKGHEYVYSTRIADDAFVTDVSYQYRGAWVDLDLEADTLSSDGILQPNTWNFLAWNSHESDLIIPIHQQYDRGDTVIVRYSYVQALALKSGRAQYSPPISLPAVRQSKWELEIKTDHEIRSVDFGVGFIPSTLSSRTYVRYDIELKDFSTSGIWASPLLIDYGQKVDEVRVWRESGDDSDDIVLVSDIPETRLDEHEYKPKRVVFVVGGFDGYKITHSLIPVLFECLRSLHPTDQFNILIESRTIDPFSDSCVLASPGNISLAMAFYMNYGAGSYSGLFEARSMPTALNQLSLDRYANELIHVCAYDIADFPPMGLPSMISRLKAQKVTVSVLSARDIEGTFLDSLVWATHGVARRIDPLTTVLNARAVMDRRIDIIYDNVAIDTTYTTFKDIMPDRIGSLGRDDGIVFLARCISTGSNQIVFRGEDASGIMSCTRSIDIQESSIAGKGLRQLWAGYQIKRFLGWMRSAEKGSGAWREWKAEVQRLGMQYGIYTPFSVFRDRRPVGIVEVPSSEAPIALRLYPNPAMSELNVNVRDEHDQRLTIEIIDLAGRILGTKDVDRSTLTIDGSVVTTFDVSRLAQGNYLLSVTGDTLSTTSQFIVLR